VVVVRIASLLDHMRAVWRIGEPMIRLLLLLLLLLLMWSSAVAVAWGEVIERAYYLCTKEPLFWAFEEAHRDPLKEDDLYGAERDIVRLGNVPYQSPYLSEGDELWDVSAEFAKDAGRRRLFEWAIFNETTGYFVFKGKPEMMDLIDALARAEIVELPRTVLVNAKVYRVRRKNVGISKWKVSDLEKRHKSLLEAEVMTRPGQEVIFKGGDGSIDLRLEPQVGAVDEAIDLVFMIEGEVEGQSFSIKTGMTGFNGLSSIIEMGSIGGEETLLLVIKPEIFLLGGVRLNDAVLDVENPSPSPAEKLIPPEVEEKWPVVPKTGKMFRTFLVPPTFASFLDSGGGTDETGDPFAVDSDEVESTKKHSRFLLKKWDPRVKGGAAGNVYDMKNLFELQGVIFKEGDFAVLVANAGLLYAKLDPLQMELLDAICSLSGPEYPRMIFVNFSLLEGTTKIEISDLGRKNLKEKFKSGLMALPGRKSTLNLKNDFYSLSTENEPQVGVKDDVIDLRGKVVFSKGKETLFEWVSGITLTSGKRQIVSSYAHDGKWYALMVEAKVEEMADWLLGE